MNFKKIILTIFVFVITTVFYYIFLEFWCSALESRSFPMLPVAILAGTFFAGLFYRYSKDIFPLKIFSVFVFFTILIFLEVFRWSGLFLHSISIIPTDFFVSYGMGIYAGISILKFILGFFITWLFYKYGKSIKVKS